MSSPSPSSSSYRFAFLIEQTLGHVAHGQNLAAAVAHDDSIDATSRPVHYRHDHLVAKLPIVGHNWTLKLSLAARSQLRAAGGAGQFDAIFAHTQVVAHGLLGAMRAAPTIVSLDATPIGRAQVEARTGATARTPRAPRRLARAWTTSVLRRAAAVVAWSTWAADSVSKDYGVDPANVHVIPPGVDVDVWRPRPGLPNASRLPRLLFVGGQFHRKGGPELLETLGDRLGRTCELDVVTRGDDVPQHHGLRVHREMMPNSPELCDLVAGCDVFVLPTKKDFSPLAILEAAACGLAVVATDVGGIPEQVEHGVTGLLVPPGDATALAGAIDALVSDPAKRRDMGAAGRACIQRHFNSKHNTVQITGLMKRLADERRGHVAVPRNPAAAGGQP
jgi:glycosyltransferase involved in cell wall biosynthesis